MPKGRVSGLVETLRLALQEQEGKQSEKDKLANQHQPVPPGVVRIRFNIVHHHVTQIRNGITARAIELGYNANLHRVREWKDVGQPSKPNRDKVRWHEKSYRIKQL